MEEIASMPFQKVERSYFSTPPGWRLATFEETRDGLQTIKEPNILGRWDRVRLLDGWILGPGYDFEMGNDFKGCLGYMLLIQTQAQASGCAYADVDISDSQKQVALFLCADDWNYEVVYWLFNSWAKPDSMDLQDVIHGRIPFRNPVKLKALNTKVCSLARNLGDKGPVSAEAAKVKFSGRGSVKKVLSDMIEIVNEENLEEYDWFGSTVATYMESCFPKYLVPDWLEDLADLGGSDWNNIADAFWNFLSECFAGSMVEIFSNRILASVCKLNNESDTKTITPSQNNFMVVSLILFYLSNARTDIIHIPLAHGCTRSCAEKMMYYVASNNGPADLLRFKQTLQNNAMWMCYDQIGNYDLLNKLLVFAAYCRASDWLQLKAGVDIFVVKRLLECGAQPGPAYTILELGDKKLTALHAAIMSNKGEDIIKEVVESLLDKCDGEQQKQLVDTPDEDGWTALHLASYLCLADTCQILLDYGAEIGAQIEFRKTALHIALDQGHGAVVNVLMKHPHITELIDLKDRQGESPIDKALAKTDIELVAKLISKSKQPEAYFDKVDLKQLLRYSLLDGSVNIVRNLVEMGTKLPAGECDEEGKTVLHLAAMCEDGSKAMDMVRMLLEPIEEKEKLVAKCDRGRRTALQEAALNGNEELCKYLLEINPKIINSKDRNGQNAMYDAAKAKQNEKAIIERLLAEYSKKDTPLNALVDRNGLTPLHVAASLGKKDIVKLLLSNQNNRKKYLKRRDSITQKASDYLNKSDFLGQTALHKAANCGDIDSVEILLNEGAHPLQERDCDGRTALHYAVKAKTGGDKKELTELLLEGCETNEEKWLLLWTSAAGLGTADESLNKDDPLHKFLVAKRNEIKKLLSTGNLLKTATSVGAIEMTKELIARGYHIMDICDTEWRKDLTSEEKANVKRVSGQLERIAEQGNDQPTVVDNLGRIGYANGLAALLLNPYIKSPIVVGISGSWGMGKSSLMVQTESILLKTAAQMALLPFERLSRSALKLPEITVSELSKKGREKYEKIRQHVDFALKGNRSLLSTMIDKVWSWAKKRNNEKFPEEIAHTEQDSLAKLLYNYQPKYRKIFKSLAAMDASDMFTRSSEEKQEDTNINSKSIWGMAREMLTKNYQQSKSSPQQSTAEFSVEESVLVEESVPAILTVQYNAWKYRNETEALAGMAVEITKELEGIMTEAQWLSTCWRNTWKKKKYYIWIEIIFPCLLAVVLACTITWILWIILDKSDKFKNWVIPKYACLPTAIVVIGWTVTRSVMSILKPVSTQLMSYISFPDHTDKLGYQERVISDITFLKEEIGRKPCMVFKAYSLIFTMISTLWFLFFERWVAALFFQPRMLGNVMSLPKIAPAYGKNLRVIVFIDDLDRCQESVILQVLSAINLVLAVCEINVVLGIDKGLIERAIIKKYGDMKSNRSFKDNKELADRYLQKIIQLPLDLPDPSEEQSRKFLEGQLGVFQDPSEDSDSELKPDAGVAKTLRQKSFTSEAGRSRESTFWDITERETVSEIIPNPDVSIDVQPASTVGRKGETEAIPSNAAAAQTGKEAQQQGEAAIAKHPVNTMSYRIFWSQIPIRELLFVRYSKGEQDAFCYFQQLATDSRKLPREWKRHLTYHRLVWNIFYLTGEAKDLAGWQVQLITWIFVCWEWRENMDFVIQNWNKVGIMKTSLYDGPSLQRIVDHFIELEFGASHREETKDTILKVSVSKDASNETESSKGEQKKSDEAVKDNIVMEDAGRPLFQENKKKNKRKKKKMKEEMRQESLEGNIDDQQRSKRTGQEKLDMGVIEQIGKLEKMLDELKKEISDLKDEAMKKHSRKNENREEEKRMKLKRWETLRLALDNYDVPMNAIQAFQRFRFYCIAGHLSWPLSEQVQRKKNIDSYED